MKKYLKKIYYKRKFKLKKYTNCYITKNSVFEGNNFIGNNTFFSGFIGYGSYISNDSEISGNVGRFTCIASHVYVINGFHPTKKIVSIHPSFYSTNNIVTESYVKNTIFDEYRYVDKKRKISVDIGNDVWIGQNVSILSGVKICDGAIVGASSVVTKDVPPYSIVVGNPAKVIRYRFTQEEIDFLLKFKWWNKNIDWIKNNANLYADIEIFIKRNNL